MGLENGGKRERKRGEKVRSIRGPGGEKENPRITERC